MFIASTASAVGMHVVMAASKAKVASAVVTGNVPYLVHHEWYKVVLHYVRPLLMWKPFG